MSTATMTGKGQMTVPKDIREKLGLKAGDKVEIVELPDGTVRLFPVNSPITALRGMVPRPKHAVTIEQMNEDIAAEAAERHRRR